MPIQGSHQHEITGVALRLNEPSQEKKKKNQAFLIQTTNAMWTTPINMFMEPWESVDPILGTHHVG